MSLLPQTRFFTTADQLHQLPMLGLPELAFAGRSNAGKSTAINTLCNQRRLAFASKTPGRTQHINFFAVGMHPEDEELPAAFLVDLPGYGYAEVARSSKAHWEHTLSGYIRHRNDLVGLILIIDARRTLTDLDIQMIEWFAPTNKPIYALLTKSDKLNRKESTAALKSVRDGLKRYGPQHGAQLFSSLKKTGVEEATAKILSLLGLTDTTQQRRTLIAPLKDEAVDSTTTSDNSLDDGQKNTPAQGDHTGVITPVEAPAQGGEAGDDVHHL